MCKGNDLLSKIKRLDNNSSIKEIMDVVEFDLKSKPEYKDIKNPIDRFFLWKSDWGNEGLEGINKITKTIYEELNWYNKDGNEKKEYFDVIYSFIGIYARGVRLYNKEFFKPTAATVLNLEWEVSRIIKGVKEDINHITKIKFEEGKREINGIPVIGHQNIKTIFFLSTTYYKYKTLNSNKDMEDFARLTHSIGNFMLCPNKDFNSKKNSKYDDLLDLYMLEEKIDEEIEWINLKHLLFLDCFEIYPVIKSKENLEAIDKDDFDIFLKMIVTKIRIRGLQIIMDVNECKEVKAKCITKIKELKEILNKCI